MLGGDLDRLASRWVKGEGFRRGTSQAEVCGDKGVVLVPRKIPHTEKQP